MVLVAWAPHKQAADTPHLDVEHVADVGVDVVEVPRLLDESGAPRTDINALDPVVPRLL